jgi:ABC-2 type transport system ATP-binding protein
MSVVEVDRLGKVFRAKMKSPGLGSSLRSLVQPDYRDVDAVRGISFSIESGEVVAFIGPNGAGKSTTIKMLSGILHASSGSAHVLGLVPWEQRQQLAYAIGTLFGQRSQLWYHLPPADSFELLATIYELPRAEYRVRMSELVERFEVGPLLTTPVRKLSLGERMRCEIVGALLHRPRVVFLDEPTIGLDVVAKQRIRGLIRALSDEEGVTVFLTSHDAGDVEQICDRAIVINHGDVIFNDSVAALKSRFIRRRLIELKLTDPVEVPRMPGLTVLEDGEFELSLEVDTDVQSVEAVVSSVMADGRVADITITEPPLEEIIGEIYGAAR